MRCTVWHHLNAYYHVNREPGDDNRESISAIQIAELRHRAAETRRLEENQGEWRATLLLRNRSQRVKCDLILITGRVIPTLVGSSRHHENFIRETFIRYSVTTDT